MQTKEERQKGALKRLREQLIRYENGDFIPSKKDKVRGLTIYDKMKRCEREIEILEKIVS